VERGDVFDKVANVIIGLVSSGVNVAEQGVLGGSAEAIERPSESIGNDDGIWARWWRLIAPLPELDF
jgi:hypothetical protein